MDVRESSTAAFGGFARIAYAFVRGHFESVAALTRVIRGKHEHWAERPEEERW